MSTLKIQTPRAFLPLLRPARYKGAYGGRASAKSHFFAEWLIEDALCGHTRAACLRETQNSIKDSSKQLLEDKIDKFGVRHLFETTETEIRGPNDSLFVFKGLQNHTAQSIKSLEGFNRAWVDEAQSISRRSFDFLNPTFRVPGSELRFSWNPDKETDPVDEFFRKADPEDHGIICIQSNYSDNPWLPTDVLSDIRRDQKRDPEKYAHVWLGEYRRKSEARVFRNWKITERQEEIPSNARPYFGADWGFAVDPTVLVRCWVWDRILYVDREIYKVGCEIDRTPDLFDKMNDERTKDIRRWPIIADSARPETISYMNRHGFKITPAKKGVGSVEDGVEFLKNHDIVVHSSCEHTINELSLYAYKVDKKTEDVLPILEDKDNHVVDALRYAVERLRTSRYDSSMSWV